MLRICIPNFLAVLPLRSIFLHVFSRSHKEMMILVMNQDNNLPRNFLPKF